MDLDSLLDERERLLGQRADILAAMSPAVIASDLDHHGQDLLRGEMEQALDNAFFDLLAPVNAEIEDHESALEFRRRRADVIDLNSRR